MAPNDFLEPVLIFMMRISVGHIVSQSTLIIVGHNIFF